ncbi:DUF1176 domain-containing protein [Vibrio neptunius]|uniref:DUF1176 domain-containing protein n=1 Tax=Vibrio neptunius TaxID=170651 RepID=UPI0019D039AE|nr:DUF1176 domain-containing protein [Vibrio neptunius]MBN3573216.1 DUF1176 domain-containing protein [Vibrio neptunius]
MRYIRRAIYSLGLVVFSANAFEGESFQHKDWYLACDNTGTCRAAGYSDIGSLNPVAVMFTREAGPATPITAKVFLGDDYDFEHWPEQINLYIDSQDLGPIKHDILTAMQVQAILAVVTKDALIEIGDGQSNWVLSSSGASAVFRRMDEYQGRLKTPFAIVAKGQRAESKVSRAEAAPKLVSVGGDAAMKSLDPESEQYERLLPQLRASYQVVEDELGCHRLFEETPSISIAKLNNGQSLIEASCWLAAYNYGSSYWLLAEGDEALPKYLNISGNEYSQGIVSSAHKGRGLGDCWSFESWLYDGEKMVRSSDSNTGLCRSIAAGGIDSMPTWVSEVVFAQDSNK